MLHRHTHTRMHAHGSEVLVRLLQAGADPLARDKHQETVLHCASRMHKMDAVALILSVFNEQVRLHSSHPMQASKGQKPSSLHPMHTPNFLGQNALMVALEWDEGFAYPLTSAYIAERRKQLTAVVQLLLEAGVRVDDVDNTGAQPQLPLGFLIVKHTCAHRTGLWILMFFFAF
jgi:hypothetical protein